MCRYFERNICKYLLLYVSLSFCIFGGNTFTYCAGFCAGFAPVSAPDSRRFLRIAICAVASPSHRCCIAVASHRRRVASPPHRVAGDSELPTSLKLHLPAASGALNAD
jgi:hypothetical protein